MQLIRRRKGSQRANEPVPLKLQNYNTVGQGGDNMIVLYDEEREMYYSLLIESDEEAREMLSAVAKTRGHVE